MAEETKRDTYGALLDVGQVFLQQAITAQRSALEYYRQFTENEGADRSLRAHQEEWVHKTLEALDPFFVLEQSARQQVLKAQVALFELCDETLRSFGRSAGEPSSFRSR